MSECEAWPGDRVPSENGYGGVHGDCPYCGEKLLWTGWGWSVHSEVYHQGVRRRLLRAVARLVSHEMNVRVWAAQNADDGLVGIRWRCGVYPGWQSEERWELPFEWWDAQREEEGGQEFILAAIREHLAYLFENQHGVRTNPATWFHKVYDGRST